jgi:hypothetical protein
LQYALQLSIGFCYERINEVKKILLASAAAGVLLSVSPALAEDAWCGRPTVFLGDTYDPDPVANVRVQYNPDYHTWNILMYSNGGRIVSRAQQYAITDYTSDEIRTWGGSLNRNHNLYMVGELHENGVYEEWLYDRSQHNRLDMHWAVRCQITYAPSPPVVEAAPPHVVHTVPVAPAPPVVQQQVVVAPAPSAPPVVTVAPVIVIPGVTGAGTIPAPPAEKPVKPEAGS